MNPLKLSVVLALMNVVSFGIGYKHNSPELMLLSGAAVVIFSLIAFVAYWSPNSLRQ